ncbi:toll/interleukin-1 receptor domain-containing protein [Sphingomonas sp. So64.6b]|uniref:toll/interleukin-1 receptor domain-containing protein n=1 Tax=Sphingomonas sp. So64.6b TaxID=2997354 RepID=UPI0016024885|nr:toll/interleukin-1 receptor domain-containing protein [Sphingomonas sp. So64.6b]QNA85461.1 toll/interleukin-1 receptor domain-containing protein [Sphingomonas sp. So64.6b]
MGDVTEVLPFPGSSEISAHFAYAVSVGHGGSSSAAIKEVAAHLGRLTQLRLDIRKIDTPLLGTGHGDLSDFVSASALRDGFSSSAYGSELRVCANGSKDRFASITNIFRGSAMVYCPHCSHDQRFSYAEPWHLIQCENCGREHQAESWLNEDLEPLGDPFADLEEALPPSPQRRVVASQEDDPIHLTPLQEGPPEHCVFLSHNRSDKPMAREIGRFLRHHGVEVWFDEWDIYGGDSVIDKLEAGIKMSDFFLLLVSPASMKSNWVRQEIRSALNRQIELGTMTIVPLMVRPVDELPPFLSDWKRIDFIERIRHPSPFDELLTAIFRPNRKPKLGRPPIFGLPT